MAAQTRKRRTVRARPRKRTAYTFDEVRKIWADLKRAVTSMKPGDDIIEVLSGHHCSPDCWHNQIKNAFAKRAGR